MLRKLCEQGHPIGHTEFAALTQLPSAQPNLPHLVMPGHHEVRPSDVLRRAACSGKVNVFRRKSASANLRRSRSSLDLSAMFRGRFM